MDLGACALVRKYAPQIARCTGEKPLADVACGSGRNAIVLARLGCKVICLDKDFSNMLPEVRQFPTLLSLHLLDLGADSWPFGDSSLGGIINVHFLLPKLLPLFARSISSSGYLLLETVPGHGGNYLQLPQEGELKSALEGCFDLELYRERKVGPPNSKSVTVKMIGKRKRREAQPA